MADWNYVEWAEKIGTENLKGRLAAGDFLLSQANTLLSFLLGGIGGAMIYGARIFNAAPAPIEWGAATVAIWLAAVAVILAAQCIITRSTPALYNEPMNVYKPELKLSEMAIRQFELENVQARINDAKARNSRIAAWLDRCRYAALATPLVFAAAAFVAGR